jgi:hypothetical protein
MRGLKAPSFLIVLVSYDYKFLVSTNLNRCINSVSEREQNEDIY